MSHFRFRPEVVVDDKFTPHSTANGECYDESIRNYAVKIHNSGFIAGKPIKPEVSQTQYP